MHPELQLVQETVPFISPETEANRGGSFSVSPTPPWVIEREVPWESVNQPGEHALFLLVDTQYSHARRTVYERIVRRINTPEAVQKLSQVDIDYDPKINHLSVHEVRLWREGQCQSFADPKRFIFRQREGGLEAQILHGRISAIQLFEDVRPGDTIECSFSLITTHELEGKKIDYAFLRERAARTMSWFVALHLPPHELPVYRQSDGQRQEPEVYDTGEEYVWVWSGRQNEVPAEEAGIPIWEPHLCWGQVSGFQNWGEVARLLSANWEPISCFVEETRAWVAGMESEGRSLEERVGGAVRWVQDKIRYQGLEMGLGGILPSAPDEVFRRRYGDCKDKSLFLCSVLKELGVEAHPLLVHTVFRGGIREHLPSMASFNHAIVTFVIDGKRGFADPTALGAGGGAFGQSLPNYELGLCIGSEIEDLIAIPHVAKGSSAWWVEEEFFLAPQGSRSTMIQRVEARGFEADMMRARLAMSLRDGYAKEESNDLKRFFPDLQPLGHVGVTDDREENHILVEARFEFSEWGQDIDTNFRVFSYNARWMTQFLSCPASHPERKRNFMLRFPLNVRHEVVVHGDLTPGTEEDHFVDSRWFRSRTRVSWEGKKTARLSYSCQNLERMVEAIQTPEFLRKFNQLAQYVGCQVRGKKKGFRREQVPERPLAEGGEAEGEAGFEPRLTGEVAKDADGWFLVTRRQKLRRTVRSANSPMSTAHLILLGVFVFVGVIGGIAKIISADEPVSGANPAGQAEAPRAVSQPPVRPGPEPVRAPATGVMQEVTDPELARADAAIRRGDIASAAPDIDYLARKYPEHPSVLLLRAMAAVLQSRTVEAREYADKALKLVPGHPLAITLLARADLMEKKFDEARKRYLHLSQFFPDTPEGWIGLSYVDSLQGRFEASEKSALILLKKSPTNPDMLKQIVFLTARKNTPEEGGKYIENALRIEPNNGWLRGLHSIFLYDQGKYPQSLDEVEEALKLQPGAAVYVAHKARVFAAMGRQEEALELAQAAVSAMPGDVMVNGFAARAYADCKKYPESIAAYTKALEINPEEFGMRNALGYTLLLSGDPVKAREELEKAVALSPTYLVAWENLLNACKQTQDNDRAAQCEARIAELKGAS